MELPPDIVIPVIAGMIALFAVLQAARLMQRPARNRFTPRRAWQPRVTPRHDPVPRARMPDAADQLRAVENADYGAQPLLRYQESLVFAAAESAVREVGQRWRVFAQVSLGEVLTCADRDGFNAINAKRVDLLVTDAKFAPIAAIEYQGGGHHLGKAAARDAVKKEALRKAGIAFVEMTGDDGPDDVRRAIARLAATRAAAPRAA
jgi:hypothetical protein